MNDRINRIFWVSVLFSLVIKLMLAAGIPITGDEAYFVEWAKHLDFGYYDHPPMVGWILKLLLFLGTSELIVRLPAVLSTILIGILIYYVLKPYEQMKAALIAVLFLVSPINILNVLITTDTPLIFFSFISGIFLYRALNSQRYLDYLISGICLGCAFLSKYFAVLLGFAYFVYFIFSKKDKTTVTGFAILFASVIPFVAVNIYWNYTHCWANILFNLFNRNKKETLSAGKFLIFVVSQLYLITPPVVYYAFKRRKELMKDIAASRLVYFAFLVAVPLIVFAVLSFKKVVGLHWVLAFYPFMYLALFAFLTDLELSKSIRFMVFFTLAHLFLIGAVLSVPVQYFKSNKNYKIIVLGTHPKEIVRHLRPYENEFSFATPSYSDSAVISFYFGRYFMVFGGGVASRKAG